MKNINSSLKFKLYLCSTSQRKYDYISDQQKQNFKTVATFLIVATVLASLYIVFFAVLFANDFFPLPISVLFGILSIPLVFLLTRFLFSTPTYIRLSICLTVIFLGSIFCLSIDVVFFVIAVLLGALYFLPMALKSILIGTSYEDFEAQINEQLETVENEITSLNNELSRMDLDSFDDFELAESKEYRKSQINKKLQELRNIYISLKQKLS